MQGLPATSGAHFIVYLARPFTARHETGSVECESRPLCRNRHHQQDPVCRIKTTHSSFLSGKEKKGSKITECHRRRKVTDVYRGKSRLTRRLYPRRTPPANRNLQPSSRAVSQLPLDRRARAPAPHASGRKAGFWCGHGQSG